MKSNEPSPPAKLTTGQDLDEALRIAEGLLDQAERTMERCRLLYMSAVGVVALVAFTCAGLAELPSSPAEAGCGWRGSPGSWGP